MIDKPKPYGGPVTKAPDRRTIWWVSFLVLLSATMSILGFMRGCGLAPTRTIVIEEREDEQKVLCGDANEGDVRQTPCPEGQDGKVFEVCRSGQWKETADSCRGGGDGSGDGSGDGDGGGDDGEPGDCGTIFADVEPILTEHCLGCHFTPEKYDEYDVAYTKYDRFLEVIQLPSDNPQRMPKEPKDVLPWEDIQLLKKWGDDGKKLDCTSTGPIGETPDQFSLGDIETVILTDLSSLDEDDRANSRYLVTSHKHNLGDSDANLKIFEDAINKNLNHLNIRGDRVFKTQEISPTIFRFDLRSFGLDKEDWKTIEDADVIDLESFTDKGSTIKFLSGARKAWLHFDTFVDVVGKAQVYYKILSISHTLHEYLAAVGVNIHEQLAALDPFFVGGNGSEISLQKNRLIVRFEGDDDDFPFTWITFDPVDPNNVDNRNLFFAPLIHGTGGTGERNFDFNASETLTQTKTGYISALWAADGTRQDAAPLNVVADTRSPLDPEINVPIDCYRCHAGGYLPMDDQIRNHVRANASQFDSEDAEIILTLYRPQANNTALFQSDNSEYADVAEKADFGLVTDPITFAHDRYKLDWNVAEVASFLFFERSDFTDVLSRSASGRAEIGQLLTGGTITFNQFVDILPDLKRELRLFQEEL